MRLRLRQFAVLFFLLSATGCLAPQLYAQEFPVFEEPPPRVRTGGVKTGEPVPIESAEPSAKYMAFEVAPHLTVSVTRDVEGASWLSPSDRARIGDFVQQDFKWSAQQKINTNKIKIFSFVTDRATARALHHPVFQGKVYTEELPSIVHLMEAFRSQRDGLVILIAHLEGEPEHETLGGFSLRDIQSAAEVAGTTILVLGCDSANYFGSGAEGNINSMDVATRLTSAVQADNLGDFLKNIAAQDLHLRLRLSALNDIRHAIKVEAVDSKGNTYFQMYSHTASSHNPGTPPSPSGSSLFCKQLGISYAFLIGTLSAAVLACLLMLAGAAYPDSLKWQLRVWNLAAMIGNVVLLAAALILIVFFPLMITALARVFDSENVYTVFAVIGLVWELSLLILILVKVKKLWSWLKARHIRGQTSLADLFDGLPKAIRAPLGIAAVCFLGALVGIGIFG